MIEQAKWIWSDTDTHGMQYRSFQADFTAEQGEVTLSISCDTCYALHLNGKCIGIGGLSDYPDRKTYDTKKFSVSAGENRLIITVYHEGVSSSCYRVGTPCLKFAVSQADTLLCMSDENTRCAVDIGYRSDGVQHITGQLGYSFAYTQPGMTVSFATKAKVLSIAPKLIERPIKYVDLLPRQQAKLIAQGVFMENKSLTDVGERMQRAFLSARDLRDICPKAVQAPITLSDISHRFEADEGDGIYLIIDLGRESVGLFTLDIDLPQTTKIDIGWGEHLDDLRTRSWVGYRSFAATVTLNAGKQQFTHYFRRLGLRYLQLHIHATQFSLCYAGILPTDYPLTVFPIKRKDALEQRIVDISIDTLRHCMHDHYEDCPWREQSFYTMDSRNQMLCGYHAFKEYDFPKYSLQLAAHSLREDGLLELCAPAECPITIPSFTLIFLKQIEEYLIYSGDEETARELFTVGKAILDGFIVRCDKKGLLCGLPGKVNWNFYEWQDGLSGEIFGDLPENSRYDAPLCGYYGIALYSGIAISKALGDTDALTRYQAAYDLLKANVHDFFWDEEKGYYQSYIENGKKTDHFAQLTGALMMNARLVPENLAAQVREKLANDKSLYPVTLSHSIYRYEALLQDESYKATVKAEILDIWSRMIYTGATTFYETADGAWAFDNAGSLCHGWSAVPLYIYEKYGLEA